MTTNGVKQNDPHRPPPARQVRRPGARRAARSRRRGRGGADAGRARLHARRGERGAGGGLGAALDALRPCRGRERPASRGDRRDGRLRPRRRPERIAHRRVPRLDRQGDARRPRSRQALFLSLRRPGRRELAGRPHAHAARGPRAELPDRRLLLLQPAVRPFQRLCARRGARRPRPCGPPRRLFLRISARHLSEPRGGAGGARDQTRRRDDPPRRLSPSLRQLPLRPGPSGDPRGVADARPAGRSRVGERQLGRRRAEPSVERRRLVCAQGGRAPGVARMDAGFGRAVEGL